MTTSLFADIATTLARQVLEGAGEPEMLTGACARLEEAGVPLLRAAIGIDTLHPVLEGRITVWRRGMSQAEAHEMVRTTGKENSDLWLRSPFYRLFETGESRLRRRPGLDYVAGEFPLVDDLVKAGASDYLAYVNRLGPAATIGATDAIHSSWTTDRPDGFMPADIELIERVLPSLTASIHDVSLRRIAGTLVETYLGRDAGRRVLSGNIQRGVAEPIRAVLWFSDLQGFTRLAERSAPDAVIPLLNDYAECLISAIHAHGGQVLKFMGDGLLAFFPIDAPQAACARAMAAAEAAREGVAALNKARAERGDATTMADIALHIGEVFYGNIGSIDRLDFTVVGPAVNALARIEAMCRSLERDVVVSQAFAAASGENRARLVSLGRYALRGVTAPEELFTLLP